MKHPSARQTRCIPDRIPDPLGTVRRPIDYQQNISLLMLATVPANIICIDYRELSSLPFVAENIF